MALYLKMERPSGPLMVRRGSRVRVPSSALVFLPQRHRSSIPFLPKVVLTCPQAEGDKSPAQESNMTLHLAIERPGGPPW
jgi:hypothetical protein